MSRLVRRICFFLAIVWRPATGPCRDEPSMTDWQVWRAYRLTIPVAWEITLEAMP